MQNDFQSIVEGLIKSYGEQSGIINLDRDNQLNRSVIIEVVDNLRSLVFPGFFGKKRIGQEALEFYAGNLLEDTRYLLSSQIESALRLCGVVVRLERDALKKDADDLCMEFLSHIGEVRAAIAEDVEATFNGDPAAINREEVISSYPGIFAIMIYRFAHILEQMSIPMLPRIMSEYVHSVSGIDIHPGAQIGKSFMIDHGTGIVIGQTTIIGNNVKIYQGVTLGALSTRAGQRLRNIKRHPTIEDNVTIYAGASILGGETVIGEGSTIGSNAFIISSVPPNSKINSRG
ncbi:MAG: serine acetyltransferase [Spirochaetaceae bacterium]|jgi:serine O-acetyltransferase|nr:serine acetyltransferase [Spirochaetaceae bacterium]